VITAVDSSVLLDVLVGDLSFADVSAAALRRVRSEGGLIICESVVAEVRPALESDAELREMIEDLGIVFTPASQESAILAGQSFATYLARGGKRGRVTPDFLIGAHAQIHAERLLARDRGYLRDYFHGLQVLDPTA
jgi:predicted nucleic acid-binding protein